MTTTLQSTHTTPALRNELTMPIQFVKGVGPHKAEILSKVGVRTLEDLLYHFPRDHQDRRVIKIKNAEPAKKQAFLVEVLSVNFSRVGKMLGQARARIRDSSGTIEAVWFKRLSFKYDVFSAVKRDIMPSKQVLVYGAVDMGRFGVELRVEDYESISSNEAGSMDTHRIVPVYPLTEGLQDRWLRNLTARIVPTQSGFIQDPLPVNFRFSQKLPPFNEALKDYHFPANWSSRDKARERLAFDEFFFLELALAINRQEREHQIKGFQSVVSKHLLTPFKNKLNYEFTRAQTRVINEIFRDMQRAKPMNRLLQGDVGSGKTVVALSAALLAIENGRQAAFLAPTEILAGQHALAIAKFFDKLPVRCALLTGSTPKPERKKTLQSLAEGKIHLLIGTHAILNEEVKFHQLGLVIIDEQHRFGVRQRAEMVSKSGDSGVRAKSGWMEKIQPDILIMTATPIPRTLALTLYGDLDVSIIEESPAGRMPIKTYSSAESVAWNRIDETVKSGQQVYVVFPLIEESEKLSKRSGKNIQAATKEFHRLQQRFPNTEVGLLHGQMSSEEKKAVMDSFRGKKISVLVATPVIEVGIDVSNATLIVIANPERFGLAQLHQLRGRVGRGSLPSECILIWDEPLKPISERLRIFCAISDGFRLAEEDLKLRGPGEFLGEAQHGVPFFRVGDLIKDGLLIARAREAAKSLVEGEWPLTLKEFGMLNRILQKRFGTKLQLSGVG